MPVLRSVYVDESAGRQMDALLRAGTTEQRLVRRIEIVLQLAKGLSLRDSEERYRLSSGV